MTVISKRNTFGTGKRSKHRYSFVTSLLQPAGWRDELQVPLQGERPPEWTTHKSLPAAGPENHDQHQQTRRGLTVTSSWRPAPTVR